MKSCIVTTVFAGLATAQVSAWGQCGGIGYTGLTTCVNGYTCTYSNAYYSQCQPGAAGTTTSKVSTGITASATTLKTIISATSGGASTPTGVQYLGRVNPSTKELSWPGTGVRFSYKGSAVLALTATGSNSGDLIIDGTTTVIPTVTSNIPLPSGSHTVEFRKRSEANLGSIFLQLSGTPASHRLIEFIGDSITVGYGLDGTLPCTNNAQVEDNPKTYAAVAANSLGADYNIVAWSGKGIFRNIGGDTGPLISELWTRYGANDADNSYTFPVQAQVVVLNIGTNDFSESNGRAALNINDYQSAVVSFLNKVKAKYPAATFFLLSSPMLSDSYPSAAEAQHTSQSNALKNAAKSTGAHFVDWPTQGSDVGCDYHPNAATHAQEGAVLASAIKQVMGW